MKKTRILSLLLVLVLVLSACGARDEEKLVGTWKTTVDLTSQVNEGLDQEEEIAGFFHVSDFSITLVYEFREDGTYSVQVDKEAMEDSLRGFRDDLSAGLEDYVGSMLGGMDITLEDLLGASGTTLDEMLDGIMDEILDSGLDSMVDSLQLEGQWKAVNGRLYTTYDVEQKPSASAYETYELSGNTLTVTGSVGVEEEAQQVYPLVLTKVE